MPRLGSDDLASAPRREAAAYADHHGRRSNPMQLSTIVMVLVFTFIVRNIFFTDYRGQQIETLRANGKTQEEIDAIVPKTISEVRQKEVERKKSAVDMQTDIAFLLQEVQDLRKMIVAKDSGGSHVASDSDKHNMNTNQGAKSAPWDSSATLGMQNGASIKTDRQIVDAVLSNT